MAVDREIPDSHVVSLADQFCDTAKMFYDAIPNSGPQAMRVNAVFAVELYIKSLDCHWVRHNQIETLGVDCDLVTTKPNNHGHKLDKLFDHLEDWVKTCLIERFSSHRLNDKYPRLLPILAEYSDNFATDRYIFESPNDEVRHPVSETVELASFFQAAVNSIERIRIG